MDAIFFFLVVIAVSILVTRTGTSALTLTGLSRESARFQARSAFSGAGFTTNEAEAVVNHPVRRRVVLLLMLLGSAGLVTTIATLVLSFSRIGAAEGLLLPAILAGGVAVLWAVSSSRWVDRWLSHLIELALNRFTELDVRDYWHLLHLSEDWKVGEVELEEGDWLSSETLKELDLIGEGILVLGIQRQDGRYVGAPGPETRLQPGDTVILYGKTDTIQDLDTRTIGLEGDAAREASRARHQAVVDREKAGERAAGTLG